MSHIYIESLGLTVKNEGLIASYPMVSVHTQTEVFNGLSPDPSVQTTVRFEPEIKYLLTESIGIDLLDSGFPVEVTQIEEEDEEEDGGDNDENEPKYIYTLTDSALKRVTISTTMPIAKTPQFIEMAGASPRNHEILTGKIASFTAQYHQYVSISQHPSPSQEEESEELDNSLTGNFLQHQASLEVSQVNKDQLRNNMASILKWYKDKLFTQNKDEDDISEDLVELMTPSEALEVCSKYAKDGDNIENELLDIIRDAAQNAVTSL